MKRKLCFLTAVLFANVAAVEALDTARLAEDVAAETEFHVVNRVQDLPQDAKRALLAIMYGRSLANFGEPFLHSQWELDSTLPAGQHLFSAVSDRLFLIAWRQFSPSLIYNVVASYRSADEFCHYTTNKEPMPSVISYTQKYVSTAQCKIRRVSDLERRMPAD